METYSFNSSYPDSNDSSPCSRDIEFENPPVPQVDDSQNNCKVKFMCSYGGKIIPRTNVNELFYVGGETKILAIDRNIKFTALLNKISALCGNESIAVKYQLPGEDLDALISVTNDDDLEHLVHEHDRLCKVSPKPVRLRIFLFPSLNPSMDVKSEKQRFIEVLNSGPIMTPPNNDLNLLYGVEKGFAITPLSQPSKVVDWEDPVAGRSDERKIGSDPIEQHIQDLQRLRIEEQSGMYMKKNDDILERGNVASGTAPVALPPSTVYWPENQTAGGMYLTSTINSEQQVYVIPAPASAYQTPIMMPVTGTPGHGYYAVHRIPPEVHREPQIYNAPPQTVPKMAGYYTEGVGFVQPANGGKAYDNEVSTKIVYAAPTPAPHVAAAAVPAEMQPALFNVE